MRKPDARNDKLGLTMIQATTEAQDREKCRTVVYPQLFRKPNVLNESSSLYALSLSISQEHGHLCAIEILT